MGVNIYIQRPTDYADHPDWDSMGYAGDREFWDHFGDLEFDRQTAEGFPHLDDRCWVRPVDLPSFRDCAATAIYPERWLMAADLLEANPDYWLYFCY